MNKTSFFTLVKNEYIKIAKKRSTKIIMVLFVLMLIAMPGFFKVINLMEMSENEQYSMSVSGSDQLTYMISDLDSEDVSYAELKKELFKYLIDEDVSWQDWRLNAAQDIYESDDKQKIQTVSIFCRTGDWRGYYRYAADHTDMEGLKWGYEYMLAHEITVMDYSDPTIRALESVVQAKNSLQFGEDEKDKAEEQIGLYQLENGTGNTRGKESLYALDLSSGSLGFWDIYMLTPKLIMAAGIVMIIVAGGIVASEFGQGTIKFLLINPVKRWKILMAKYFTVLSMGLGMAVFMELFTVLSVGAMFGFDLDVPYLTYSGGAVHELNSFVFVTRAYLLSFVQLVVTATLAFCLSSLVRSSALAIGVSLGTLFIGSNASAILGQLGVDWARFLVFSNTDLLTISQGGSVFPEHTLFFALCVIAAHMTVFILTAYDAFTRRSV